MNRSRRHFPVRTWSALGLVLAGSDRALACAVCFGDPESSMAKGAVAGVIVLVGVIGFVLLGIAGTGLFWVHRSRRLAGMDHAQPPAMDTTNPR